MEKIDVSTEISDDRVKEIVDEVILEYGNEKGLSVREKYRLQKEIYDSIRGLDILEELLEDKNITEIMINGPDNIFIEKDGRIEKYNNRFSSKEKLVDIIQQIVSGVNRRVNESSPIVDSRLSDGSRVNVVLNPVAINGPVVTIRKFPEYSITMKKLIEIGSISLNVADFLKLLVNAKYNIFISGGTGSGKTTFLNVLSNYIPGDERIITIEDSAELQIQSVDNLVRMEVRQANDEGENGIDIRALIKSSLRMRPDRIIVGEVRGAEALDMLQAMNTGHDGSLSTGHGNSPKDMLNRLETMVLMGVDMPLKAIKSQIASGIDIIVHLGRLRDRTRKVLEIVEITGFNGEEILTNTIYRFEEDNIEGTNKGIVKGKLKWTGNTLINQKKLFDAGYGKEDISYGE
ncbi:CpaF family protein [Bovifimicola ammoniilytica]|uniref:CpaF family protein n=1 Tax=Bovifimicola ammoniilytica TaxID=2981720 RepID=UPI0011CA6E4D|nr:CpaF family protein [Bovifimicola ammoniilytica]MCU6754190.1 CpaF family protein [Bovifimicola ammoniilytica]